MKSSKRNGINVLAGIALSVVLIMTNIFGIIAGGKACATNTQYPLIFFSNGGSGTMSSQTVTVGDVYMFPACTFTPPSPDQIFSHWVMSGEDGLHSPGDTLLIADNCAFSGQIAVTAYWRTSGSSPAVASGPNLPVDSMKGVKDSIFLATLKEGPQTVYIKDTPGLSYEVLEMLQKNPQITLVSEFTYNGVDFKLTIPGKYVTLNPEIGWYGPKYLYPAFYTYGTDTLPALSTYLENFS